MTNNNNNIKTLSYKNNLLYITYDDTYFYGENVELKFQSKDTDIDCLYNNFKNYINNLLNFHMLYNKNIKYQIDNIYIVDLHITKSKQDIIVLPVNYSGKIDKKYQNNYPKNYQEYNQLCVSTINTNQNSLVGKTMYCNKDKSWQTIVNCFIYRTYNNLDYFIDYNAMEKSLNDILDFYFEEKLEGGIAIPMFTKEELGNSDWIIIFNIIKKIFDGTDISIFIYDVDSQLDEYGNIVNNN